MSTAFISVFKVGSMQAPSVWPCILCLMASLVAQTVKNMPAMEGHGFNPWAGRYPGDE